MDLGPVPPELQGLTQVEEMLISAVMPMMSLYHLPYGQLEYRGHVINLPQDVSTFARSLPRHPESLEVVIVHRADTSGTHHDFRVRRSAVLFALLWLQRNNLYYKDIPINTAALEQLPEDDQLPGIPVVTFNNDTQNGGTQLEEWITWQRATNQYLSQSFVPIAQQRETHQELVRGAITQRDER